DPAGTPNVSYMYDRRGRQKQVARNGATATTVNLTFNDADQPTGESYPSATGGTLAGISVTPGYDSSLRRGSLALTLTVPSPTRTLNWSYGYNFASLLQTVSDGA